MSAAEAANVVARTRDRRPVGGGTVDVGGAAGPDHGPDAADRAGNACIPRPAVVPGGRGNLKSLPQPKALQ
jgi:hypothetical protein